jgi:hypothetical protein
MVHTDSKYGTRVYWKEGDGWKYYGAAAGQNAFMLGYIGQTNTEIGFTSYMAIDGSNKVYILFGKAEGAGGSEADAVLMCYDLGKYDKEAGATHEWRLDLDGKNKQYYSLGTVIGEDGTIYVSTTTGITAVNPDGTKKWYTPAGGEVMGSPAVDKNGNVQNFDYGTYGNASFYVSDDGTTTNKFYCYRVLYLGNKKWATGSGDVLKVGDDVVVCAKLTNYNGTPETQQNEGYLYSLNGKTEGGGGGDVTPGQPQGDGSEGNPFNVAAAIAKCKEAGETATTQSYYIKGITDKDYTISSYKNFEANIVDSEGSSETFKVFRVKDKDGKGLKEGWKIAKGSTIIVYGPVVNYKGNTPETATGAYLVSVNGKDPELDGGTGGGDTPGGGGNELTVAASSLGLDNGVEVGSKTLADGTTLTCDGGGNTNAPKYYTAGNGTVRMYPNNTMALNASKKIASIEIVCNEYNGTLYNASGNVTATSGTKAIEGAVVKFTGINASSVTITNSAEGSGAATQIRWESLKITYAE